MKSCRLMVVLLLATGFAGVAPCAPISTTIDTESGADQDGQQDPWVAFEAQQPWLAGTLKFFSPPALKALGPLGPIVMLLVGMAAFGAASGFEGTTRAAFIALALYCAGSLISVFVLMSLVGKGVLSP